ncbi:MAG: T9SS type A sorting domain-containing protein [Chlorobiota bacterium]
MIRILLLLFILSSYTSLSSDLLIKRIDAPLKQVTTSDPITFIYTVENVTPQTSSNFQTTIQLYNSDANKIFEDIVDDSSIPGFNSRTTGSSKTWNPVNGNFLLIVSIENEGDQNIENNKVEYEFIVSLPIECPKSAPILKFPVNQDNTLSSVSGTVLKWENPGDEDSVCVYISRSKEEVKNEDPNTFLISGVDLTSFAQYGIEKNSPDIYWKVVAKCGNNKKSSPTWSFSTRSCEVENATNLKPDYGTEITYNNFRLNKFTELTWDLPEDPLGEYIVNVYLSSDSAAVQNLFPGTLIAQGNSITSVRIDGMNLAPETDYYWLVMVTCPVSYETFAAYTSSKFRIGGLSCYAKDPIPGTGNTQISTVLKQLRWTLIGDNINETIIYFSSNYDLVESSDSKAILGSFNGKLESIPIQDELDSVSYYYWKVTCGDELESPIWEFKTSDCAVPNDLFTGNIFKNVTPSLSISKAADVKHSFTLYWAYNGYEQMNLYMSTNKESVINHSKEVLYYQKQGFPLSNHSFSTKLYNEGKYYWTVSADCNGEELSSEIDSIEIVSYLDTLKFELSLEDIELDEVEASEPEESQVVEPSDFKGLKWGVNYEFGGIKKGTIQSDYDLEDVHVFLSLDSNFSGDITNYWVGKSSDSFLRAEDFEKQEFLPLKNETSYYWFIANFDKKSNELIYISPVWSFTTQPLLSINDIKNDFEFSVSPNPATNQLNLSFDTKVASDVTLEVYDINLRRLSEIGLGNKSIGKQEEIISIGSLPAGVYFIILNQSSLGGKNYRSIQKVIKK